MWRAAVLPADGELTPAGLDRLLFGSAWHRAFRIEVRRGYHSDTRDPRWAAVRRGDQITYDPDRPWYQMVRQAANDGRYIRRVRVLDTPITPGQHYLQVTGAHNVRSGERIRLLARHRADTIPLRHDTWLLQGSDATDTAVIYLRFGPDDVLTAALLTRNTHSVRAAQARWRAAWSAARHHPGTHAANRSREPQLP
jgi:hypothetical protein